MVSTARHSSRFGTAKIAAAAMMMRTVADQAITRYEQPEDLVGLLVFLASRESAFVTGQTILIDGGRTFL